MCKRDDEEPYLCINQTENIDNDLYCNSNESNQLWLYKLQTVAVKNELTFQALFPR